MQSGRLQVALAARLHGARAIASTKVVYEIYVESSDCVNIGDLPHRHDDPVLPSPRSHARSAQGIQALGISLDLWMHKFTKQDSYERHVWW